MNTLYYGDKREAVPRAVATGASISFISTRRLIPTAITTCFSEAGNRRSPRLQDAIASPAPPQQTRSRRRNRRCRRGRLCSRHISSSAKTYHELILEGDKVSEMLQAFYGFIGTNQMMAYLVMAVRLKELHRVLKPTGSLYLHCDPTASHHLGALLRMREK